MTATRKIFLADLSEGNNGKLERLYVRPFEPHYNTIDAINKMVSDIWFLYPRITPLLSDEDTMRLPPDERYLYNYISLSLKKMYHFNRYNNTLEVDDMIFIQKYEGIDFKKSDNGNIKFNYKGFDLEKPYKLYFSNHTATHSNYKNDYDAALEFYHIKPEFVFYDKNCNDAFSRIVELDKLPRLVHETNQLKEFHKIFNHLRYCFTEYMNYLREGYKGPSDEMEFLMLLDRNTMEFNKDFHFSFNTLITTNLGSNVHTSKRFFKPQESNKYIPIEKLLCTQIYNRFKPETTECMRRYFENINSLSLYY